MRSPHNRFHLSLFGSIKTIRPFRAGPRSSAASLVFFPRFHLRFETDDLLRALVQIFLGLPELLLRAVQLHLRSDELVLDIVKILFLLLDLLAQIFTLLAYSSLA